MKKLFVVSTKNVNRHVGEEYDSILEVPHQPTDQTIQDDGNKMKDRIRGLWNEQVKPNDPNVAVVNPKVAVYLDAASPYNVMLINLQIIMKAEEGIVIELPYLDDVDVKVDDPEAQELLRNLDSKR